MKTKHFLLLMLLPLFAAQCKKEETHKLVTVGGYAVDVATGDTLGDVKIRLRRQDFKPGRGNQLRNYVALLDSTITDEKGYFTFTLDMEINKSYAFEPIKESHWWWPTMQITEVHSESGLNLKTPLTPLIYLKIRIVNELPISEYDSIYYNGPSELSSQPVKNWHDLTSYKHRFGLRGAKVDTTFFVTLLYYEVPLQYWDVTKNGTTIRNAAYIGCNPLDTCFFQIKY